MSFDLSDKVILNNHLAMPRFGLGLWGPREGQESQRAVEAALESGYRLFDTAFVYENEKTVGRVLRESGLARSDYFVVSKLWNDFQGSEGPFIALQKSLDNLGLDYVDLYLIHWPVAGLGPLTWEAFQKLEALKLIRSAGAANYSAAQMKALIAQTGAVPQVWQTELHPLRIQSDVISLAQKEDIKLMAYSPLARGRLKKNEIIGRLAQKYVKTRAQIILRWAWQMGWAIIPKSVNPERIRENVQIFDFNISETDLLAISRLNQGQSVLKPPFIFDQHGYVTAHSK
jgi:diketogulonate reductase-like aldo/keto reductase